MIIFKRVTELYNYLLEKRNQGFITGFVPTMGALHQGHLSLINESNQFNDLTICSIFVNPAQFNDPADFEKYPVTIENDIYLLETNGCDILFLPTVDEIYPNPQSRQKQYNLGFIETILEGKYRPGHFQGVCLVVDRLLDIVVPANLYMGQKDYQQCMVIKKLLSLTHKEKNIQLHVCPTLRETGGLAMSSRNMRLNEEERKQAQAIYETLQFIKENFKEKDFNRLKEKATTQLIEKGFKPDYVEIADDTTLNTLPKFDPQTGTVALIAAHLNNVRLIDNLILNQ